MQMSTGASYNEGWHEVTIREATEGVWKGSKGDSKYIDLLFENYTDTMKIRMFEVRNKETNEEFKLANLFRQEMAGIINKLDDPTGKKPILQYDDDVANLVGTRINAFIFKNDKGYSEFFDTVAPVEQEGEHYSFNADQVSVLKTSAERNFAKSNKSKHLTNGTILKGTPVTNTASLEDIPF